MRRFRNCPTETIWRSADGVGRAVKGIRSEWHVLSLQVFRGFVLRASCFRVLDCLRAHVRQGHGTGGQATSGTRRTSQGCGSHNMNGSDPPLRKRRWYQFNLRTLMLFVIVCAGPVSWLAAKVHTARNQRQAVRENTRFGASMEHPLSSWPPRRGVLLG